MVFQSVLLGGIHARFFLEHAGARLTVSAAYRDLQAPGEPEARIQLHLEEQPGPPPGVQTFQANNWVAYRQENGVWIEFGKKDMPPDRYVYSAFIDQDGLNGDIYLNHKARTRDPAPVEVPPPMLDAILTLQLLSARRGLMFHACGLALDARRGLLFAGVSGSGKSTTARLWSQYSQARLLGDERIAVRQLDGRFQMFSTPWHSDGIAVRHGSARLQRVFILAHDTRNRVQRLSPADAVARLLARAYLPSWDARGMDFTLEFLDALCQSLPCYLLGFTPDRQAVEFVTRLIEDV